MTAPRYQRPRQSLWHRTSRRLLVNPDAKACTLELRDIPALVWEVLAEPASLDELVEDLAAVFDQPAPAVRHEVSELLASMLSVGLVERH